MSELRWQKSSFSEVGGNNCVEIATVNGCIALRESDAPARTLASGRGAFQALIAAVKVGRFDHRLMR